MHASALAMLLAAAAAPPVGPALDLQVIDPPEGSTFTLEVVPGSAPGPAWRWSSPSGSGPEVSVPPGQWYRGPGVYTFRLELAWAGAPPARLEARLALSDLDTRLSGLFLSNAEPREPPELMLEVASHAPAGVALQPLSAPGASGWGRYRLTNRTPGPLQFGRRPRIRTERLEGGAWKEVPRGPLCVLDEPAREVPPGGAAEVDERAEGCGLSPLPPGRYRHVVRLQAPQGGSAGARVDLDRFYELAWPFEVGPGGLPGVESVALPDQPWEALRLGIAFSTSRTWSTVVRAPTGEQACVCPGTRIGRERRLPEQLTSYCLFLKGPEGDCIPFDPDRRGDFPSNPTGGMGPR